MMRPKHDTRAVDGSDVLSGDPAASDAATQVASDAGGAPEPSAAETPAELPPSADGQPEAAASVDEQEARATEELEAEPGDELEQLTAKARKAQEYLELAQRTKADFENYRRRASRDASAALERGVAKLARELLPAIDNLDRTLEAAETTVDADGAQALVSGIKLVHADFLAALSRAGIERFSPQGEPFDPQRHEAVAQQPVDGAEPGTIVEVYQRGYRLGDAVIRPARVVVAG